MTDDPLAARYVVTGAAGFVGSHLCEALLRRGHRVVGVDDLSSGRRANLAPFVRHPAFVFREADVDDGVPVSGQVDGVFHLITPTPATSSIGAGGGRLPPRPTGVDQVAELAARRGCRLLVVGATGGEYEDPFTDPADPALVSTPLDPAQLRVARLFDAYGPRMEPEDQPTLMRLLLQVGTGQPMVVPAEPMAVATCFVSDLVNGMLRLFRSPVQATPVDLGDPREHELAEIVELLRALTRSEVPVEVRATPVQPARRTPDPTRAAELLGWAPRVSLAEGLASTWAWLLDTLGPTVGARRTA